MSYFKIENDTLFYEWKRTANLWEKSVFEAKILPDRNYINDMLFEYEKYWDKIDELEFNDFLKTL